MPIKYKIDSEHNLIIRTVSGTLTSSDVLNVLNESLDDKDFVKDMHAIWDISNAEIHQITVDTMNTIVEHIKTHLNNRGSKYKIAIVAPEDLNFGISRMFATYGSDLPVSIGIHRDIDDAYRWLEIIK